MYIIWKSVQILTLCARCNTTTLQVENMCVLFAVPYSHCTVSVHSITLCRTTSLENQSIFQEFLRNLQCTKIPSKLLTLPVLVWTGLHPSLKLMKIINPKTIWIALASICYLFYGGAPGSLQWYVKIHNFNLVLRLILS